MASMLEILKRGAELVNNDQEFVDQMVELDGDIIYWRFEDDKPSVTTSVLKGKVVVEEGENPDSQLGMQLKCKVLLDVVDNSLEAKMMYTYTELVKGDIELARHHVFALVPLIFGMQDYYESDDDFRAMIVGKKKEVGGDDDE
ncbi:MAG: hypothetical protein GY762_14360 [Proteobacteria bacterium]|nr:hypothetical protein [Pseudomonadota bacterium]